LSDDLVSDTTVTTLSWFTSYLSGRTQTFHVSGTSSDQLPSGHQLLRSTRLLSRTGWVIAYTEDKTSCLRCSTVTESSIMCMPTTSRLTLTHQSSRRSYSPCQTTKLQAYPWYWWLVFLTSTTV